MVVVVVCDCLLCVVIGDRDTADGLRSGGRCKGLRRCIDVITLNWLNF